MSRIPRRPMRLPLAAVALVVAGGPGWAGPKCMAHVHSGAPNYLQEGDFGAMSPEKHVGPHVDLSTIDDEVDSIDAFPKGGPWVYRVHGFVFKRSDVDLSGNCSHLGPH